MGNLNEFFRDLGRNAYGLGENVASLGSAAIAEPVAGFAAMYDPANGAQAIREGMTYTPRSQAGQMYQQGAARTLGAIAQPAMPVIDTWQRGVDIAGGYSPAAGAMLRTVPAAIGVAMGAKPALQAGRQVSNSLGAMQGRMIANANAPRTLNEGYMGQRGAIGLTNDFDNSDEIKIIADYLGQSPESMLVNRDLYTKKQGAINSLVSRYEQMDDFSGAYYPTSYGYISISPSAKSNGQWQLTSFDKKMNPLSDQGEMPKNKALTEFFKTIKPNKYGNITPVQTTPKRPLTEFEQAHLTAQRNAALSVNQGGLGLAADNTAMDRARAMGYDVDNPVYHGTNWDIEAFDPKKSLDVKGVHVGQQHQANHFSKGVGGANYPLLIKKQRIMEDMPDSFLNPDRLYDDFAREVQYNELTKNSYHGDLLSKAKKADEAVGFKTRDDGVIPKEKAYFRELNRILKENDIDSISYENEKEFLRNHDNTSYLIPDVRKVRSVNAAFDPKKAKSSNLLAQSAKFAPAATLGALMANEKRKDKRN